MKTLNGIVLALTLSTASALALSACGDSSSSETAGQSALPTQAPALPEMPLVGEFEMSGPEPFAMSAAETGLQCQSASPGSPFRAQWNDPATGMNVLVTGWPAQDGGSDTRVDNFQVVRSTRAEQIRARLSGARLSVEEISRTGYSAVYSVHASGTFNEGGTFTASGHCRA